MNTSTMQNKGLEVIEERTKLHTPYEGGKLTFLHPHYGPDTYDNVASSIEKDQLATPTLAQTTSLAHAAFHTGNSRYAAEIKDILKKRWLWGFTGILYVPNEGAYVQDHPKIQNDMPFMEKSGLVRKLETHDPTVRFVPFGFKTEVMSALELSRNPFVQALTGEEGAEKLAEIADKHKNKPYLWSFTSVNEPITRVGALGSDWSVVVRRLGVDGDRGGYGGGCAFGVRQ